MAFTAQKALAIVEHAGYGDTGLPPLDLVNEAGRRMCQMRPWWWMQAPPITVGVRGPVTITGASWAEATKILTATGQFADYVHAHGDLINLTAGTATNLRRYVIEERLNDNGVRLSESIGATASAIDGEVEANAAVIMPANFGGQLNAYSMTNNLTSFLGLVSQQELTTMRAGYNLPSAGSYSGCMFVGMNLTAAGGEPAYRLELYPKPTVASASLFTFSYQYAWKAAVVESALLRMPEWIEGLFVEVLRAVVQGYESEEEGTVSERVNAVRSGAAFLDAVNHDSLMQPSFGMLTGGAELAYRVGHMFPDTPVADLP